MFEDLLKSLGIGNTKPTQQGKDALNSLLANTNTGVQYNEPTVDQGTNALNTLLANAAPAGSTPIQYTPQPTALDNLINGQIPGFQDFASGALNYGLSNIPTVNGAFLSTKPGTALQLLGTENEQQFAKLTDSNGALNAKAGNLDNFFKQQGIDFTGDRVKLGDRWYAKSDIGNALAGYTAGKLGLSDTFLKGGALIHEEKNINNLKDEITRDWKYYDAGFKDSGYESDVSKLLKGLGDVGSDVLDNIKSGLNTTVDNANRLGNIVLDRASQGVEAVSGKVKETAKSFSDRLSEYGDVVSNELKYQKGLDLNYDTKPFFNVLGNDIQDLGRQLGTIGGSFINMGKLGLDNQKNDNKYIKTTLSDTQREGIQDYYNKNIDKVIDGTLDNKKFLEDINSELPRSPLSYGASKVGFQSVEDVAGFLNDNRANTVKAIQRNKDWNFLTDEQKAYTEKVEKYTKANPKYKDFETYYNNDAGKSVYLDQYKKSNIRGGFEVLKSDIEYSLNKQATTLISMENRGASDEEKAKYKEQSDKLIDQQILKNKTLIDDMKQALSQGKNFDEYATEKYKDLGGIDGFIQEGIKNAGVEGVIANPKNFNDAMDQLSSDVALGGFGEGSTFLEKYQGNKQAVVGAFQKIFEQTDKAVRGIQGSDGTGLLPTADFSAAGLAGLSDVDFSTQNIYKKSTESYLGEAATLVPDIISVFLPGGQFKVAGRLANAGSKLQGLKTASSIANGLAYGAGGTLKALDYGVRLGSLTKDVVTLGVLDEINAVSKLKGTKVLQGLSDAHLETLTNVANRASKGLATPIKVAQELAKDNAISGLISRYTSDAYGGQESNRWNDTYVDAAFNVFDIIGGVKQGMRALDGIKKFQSTSGQEVAQTSGQLGAKSLSLRGAEQLGDRLDTQVYAIKGIIDKQSPAEFKNTYEQFYGKTITQEESNRAMNELKFKMAKDIIAKTDLGATTPQQLIKLKQIDALVQDKTIAPNGLLSFIREGTAQSIARAQGLDAGTASLIGRNISNSLKLSGDILAENSIEVKLNTLGETLGLTVPKIDESEANRIEGILSSEDKKLDDYFTKQDDGNYVLKEDKYDEVGVVENKPKDVVNALFDNQVITQDIKTKFQELNAEDVLSKAIGNILC